MFTSAFGLGYFFLHETFAGASPRLYMSTPQAHMA